MSRTPAPTLRRAIRWETIPKPGGGVRHLVALDPVDDRAFARTVAAVAPAVSRALDDGSFANRVATWDEDRGPTFEPWMAARRRWSRETLRLEREGPFVATTDVRDCYPSITSCVVRGRLRALGAADDAVDGVAAWLRAFQDAGVQGLPIGPKVSAVLADAVLSAGDQAIRAAGVAHTRWVDDVTILAPDLRSRATALDALRRTWRTIGLESHDEKTVILEPGARGSFGVPGSNSPGATDALR